VGKKKPDDANSKPGAFVPKQPDQLPRRVPRPRESPKRGEEAAKAQRRLQAILQSPSYRQADEDVEFLNGGDTRGVRLQIDYLKAELELERLGIEGTIVVFGSTRIQEPSVQRSRVEDLLRRLASDPKNPALLRRLAVAERLLENSKYYDVAREFGRLVGLSGDGPKDDRLVAMTGGGPGIMEAFNRGAFDVGALSVGLNITLPHEQYPNPYITPELCFCFHYFAIRKLHFLLRAKALVVFPGGYGTFDELFEVLTLVQTRTTHPVPVVLVGEAYWKRAFDVGYLADEGVIESRDRELFWHAETAQEIWDGIVHWYEQAGLALISRP
jgi:uncharacterized protein (TIGR00730 family)